MKMKKEVRIQIFNMEEIGDMIGQVTGIMTTVIGSIAGISLLIGGIGVMNIMLVSVTERTTEIGIRMSIGATRLFGGLIGILFGVGGAAIVSHFAGWPSLVSLPIVIGGILFSMFIGVVFGILPANKAAKMKPVQALGHK
jgi:putative ABC transport system permease protein